MALKKKPALRFKGFTDDWEQRKLGAIFEEYSDKGHPNLSALTIIQGGGTIRRDDSDRNLQYDKKSLANYKKVETGDFIVHLRSFEGGLEKATTSGIISPAYHTFHGEDTDSRFYYCYFRSERFINHDLKPHVYGIRDGRSIDIEGMKTINIPWTKVEEQKAIGNYIDCLDHLITLHQRKYAMLKKIKKSFLEKMFPKNGKRVPELRFSGFTDDWEQCKVVEVAPLQRGFDLPASQMKDGPYPVIMSNGVGGWHSQYKAKGPGVVTGRSGTIGKLHYIEDNYWPHNTTLWVTNFHGNNEKFIYYLYQKLDLTRFQSGSGVPTLNRNDVHDSIVSIPLLKEQRQIADCLSGLDNLITLHQRKLEKLQNLKKALLKKMFI
jgi:type I restriction enzyme, S subunit